MPCEDPELSNGQDGNSSGVSSKLPTELDQPLSFTGHVESELDHEIEENLEKRSKSSSKELFCFHCNRPESHGLPTANRWFGNFILGLTFGLSRWIGPFYCRCCGNRRLMWWDEANLRYHIYRWNHSVPSRKSSRRR